MLYRENYGFDKEGNTHVFPHSIKNTR